MRVAPVLLCFALAGCGRYADFQLPDPGPAESGEYRWLPDAAPVLDRGAPGEWDGVDALNPSVIRRPEGLLNFYSGFDGKLWHTGLASSRDGIAWQKSGHILSPGPAAWDGTYIAANGAALAVGGEILYWYQGGSPPQIGLARSRDAATWSKLPTPVLAFGPRGSWDERATADPYILRAGGKLYLYYLGEDRARQQRLGVAASDDGITWTRLRANPILAPGGPGSMDENGAGEPAVWAAHGSYWMLYTGRARNEVRRMALARSRDGITWTRTPLVIEGAEPWNSKVVCDATVLVEDGRVQVWFGGGDVAAPAENLHGRIGHGILEWSGAK
jgi:hypothetical protein